jgi:hypothetical protein
MGLTFNTGIDEPVAVRQIEALLREFRSQIAEHRPLVT